MHLVPHHARRRRRAAESNRALKERLVARGGRTPRSCSTATWRSPGRSTAPPTSCRTSTTASSTTPELDVGPTTGSPASSSTGATAGAACPRLALRGALDLIAQAGGGVVEAYPQTPRASASRSSTTAPAALFERRRASSSSGRRARGNRHAEDGGSFRGAAGHRRLTRSGVGPRPPDECVSRRRTGAAPGRTPPAARCAPSGRRP